MKDNRKLKGILSAILFLILIAVTINVNAVYFNCWITTNNSAKGGQKGCTYFDDVYCIEQGAPVRGKIFYNETGWYDAEDPTFINIINMSSDRTTAAGDWGESSKKQHLVWWYTNTTNGKDAIKIRDIATSVGYPIVSDWTWGLADRKLGGGQLQDAINKLPSANSATNASINIDSINPNGENYRLKVSGTFDSYNIYVNNNYYTTTSNTEIDIPASKMTEATTTIKVDARKSTKFGRYKIYYTSEKRWKNNANRRCQTLIRLEKGERETSASASKLIYTNVNVSMQKYITKVNGKDITAESNLIDRKNTYPTKSNERTVAWVEKDNMKKDSYKNEHVVSIEAGDYVTYRIHVYNNSTVNANNVVITDKLPIKSGEGSYSINGGNFNSIPNNGEISYTISKLKGGESQYFEVTVYFGKYKENVLENYAKITSTSPVNKTIYRVEDSDYVEMKKYAVSLEKWISEVNGKKANNVDTSKYKNIITYLKNYLPTEMEEKLNDLINSNLNYTYYSKYFDLDNDNKIDSNDKAIYERIKGINREKLKKYINADINLDGKVDENDLSLYKALKVDINGDKKIDNADRFTYILKMLSNTEKLNEDMRSYLNICNLRRNLENGLETIKSNIENIIKSDINNDGIINDSDYYVIENNQLNKYSIDKKLESSYNLKTNKTEIDKITNTNIATGKTNDEVIQLFLNNNPQDISVIEKILEILDLNKDGKFDSKDIGILSKYNNNFSSKFYNTEIEKQIQKKIDNPKNSPYNLNGDNVINFDDYYASAYELDEDVAAKLKELLVLENSQNNQFNKHDLNGDGKFDYVDYEFVLNIEYLGLSTNTLKTLKQQLENIEGLIKNYNIIESQNDIKTKEIKKTQDAELSTEGIIAIKLYRGWKKFNNSYLDYKKYDLNNDGFINESDIDVINKFNENTEGLKNSLGEEIVSDLDQEEFITYFNEKFGDTNSLSELNLQEINAGLLELDTNKSAYTILKQIINELTKNNTTNVELTGIEPNLAKGVNYKYIKDVIEEISKLTDKELLEKFDADGNGVINSSDLDYYDSASNRKTTSAVSNLGTIDYDKLISDNDLDGDGDWDNDDDELFKEIIDIKGSSNKEDKKAEILEAAKSKNGTSETREGHAEHKYDDDSSTYNDYKYNNVVDVSKGDEVTYTIKVKNDGNTDVYITEITDYLPNGIEYNGVSYNGEKYCTRFDEIITDNAIKINNLAGILLKPGENASFKYTVKVTETDISANVLKNTATISKMENKNKVEVKDSTPNNNTDSDYFQMKDINISGIIWNDRSFGKGSDEYDGRYNETVENKITDEVKVTLYRNNDNTVFTNVLDKGEYQFVGGTEFVKGPKVEGTNRWSGTYYSYYVIFEYDGIKYTPTTFKDVTSNDPLDSNAKEDGQKVKESRANFNRRFTTINSASGIEYSTVNEQNYIPQSKHKYNSNKMGIQASTNLIQLSKSAELEEQLKHVNLGLRGRDIFDLELMSDIYSTKITVNGQEGEYQYGNNIVTVRRSDIKAQNGNEIAEDSANTKSETRTGLSRVSQDVRKTDIKNEAYEQTGLKIEVTYKFTVTNASVTRGTATKIADYYDNRYTFARAYDENGNSLRVRALGRYNGFNMVELDTNKKMLNQNDTMDIYIVYNLNEAPKTLEGLLNGTVEIPTYNIAEIVEYTTDNTTLAANQTQYTRGLIDKDSAPGSANREQVRLSTTVGQDTSTTSGNPTTVQYYFNKKLDANKNDDQYLMKLKYEDDTYTSPILYFVSSDNQRTINGTVFRDNTTTNATTKIKTGNGKIDSGEIGVYGATVRLFESTNDGAKLRYTVNTDKNGNFAIRGFLPGNYYIRYYYGENSNTTLLNAAESGINKYSYNGEDYQSTNNTGTYGAAKLNDSEWTWYVYNEREGISTATDDSWQRNEVSNYVTNFIDEEMQVLNYMRDGKKENEAKVTYTQNNEDKTVTVNDIIKKTWMYSDTKGMLFTVEKSYIEDNRVKQPSKFGTYIVENMNFGIAEVPVTTIDLQKHVKAFTITDSTGQNVLASMLFEDGKWVFKGDVIAVPGGSENIDVSIENEKLQGARLEVTYEITSTMKTEKNFDNKSLTVPTIKGIVDYINNNLVYNQSLGDNSKYWELTTYDDIKKIYEAQQWNGGTKPQGTADREGKTYTTIVKAKEDNPLLLKTEGTGTATITLEKVLTSTSSTIEQIIMSTTDTFEYNNTVEITGLDYSNVTPGGEDEQPPQRDRIRTPERYIIVPGVHHDTQTSETIVVHPPTGENNGIVYLVIAIISLGILAGGTFAIKKFVLKK